MSTLGALEGHRIVPVITIDDAGAAVDLAEALIVGGIHCAEVVFRTPAALAAIRAMAGVPGFTVGAGTVVSPNDARDALAAGASFVVSPGFDPEVVELVADSGFGMLAGVATATEAQRAVRAGLDVVKFFPADRLGGIDTIRALAAPFPRLGFVPSGGVTAETAGVYLADPAVPAVSGSWMAPRSAIAARDWDLVAQKSAETVAAIGPT
jgi:2-dehydro-3-deoxyphosphogluconate aldolase/(4S)-4-hydroxy-2-oxoglutarate aldolase